MVTVDGQGLTPEKHSGVRLPRRCQWAIARGAAIFLALAGGSHLRRDHFTPFEGSQAHRAEELSARCALRMMDV